MKLKRLPKFSNPEPIYMRADPPVEQMEDAVARALAGNGWFDCWASVDEAARVAVEAILMAASIDD